MALGDIYELVDRQTFLGQEIINRYHYRNVVENGTAEGLAIGWIQDVLLNITPIQSSDLQHTVVDVINLDDETDFFSQVSGISGGDTASGENLAPFIASRLRILRSSRAIRNGSKRYAGLREGMVNGTVVTTSYHTGLQTLADALQLQVTSPLGGNWELVLYGDVTPNRPAPIVVAVADVEPSFAVTTQNTRKTWIGT